MNALASRMPAVTWRQALAEALDGSGRAWVFVFKACLAVLLTGWLAMRLGLESPGTAMLTSAIVINPQSGMVLAKSFYRAIGTLVGCLASVALVAAFPQQRALLLLGMALWLGLCAGGASLHRNFKSYGFVLAGYTATIVALPVLDHPQGLFDSAVMRASEVMLGILVAGMISDAIAPQRLSQALRSSIRAQFTGFVTFVRGSMAGALEREALEKAHLRFVREVVEIENLRSSVVFEDAGVRVRSPRTRRLNQRFMAVSTSYQTLHHLMNRLQGDAHAAARDALTRLFATIDEALSRVDAEAAVTVQAGALARALQGIREPLQRQAEQLRQDLARRDLLLDFDTGAELVMRFADELHAYARAYVDLTAPSSARLRIDRADSGFAHGNDWLGAAMITLRTTGVMLVTGWFWIATAWSAGADAMLIATIFCGLMASSPDPVKAAGVMWKGWLIGGTAAFVCAFGVLEHMDGFGLLAAGLVPFLMACFYLYTRPALVPLARATVLSFLILLEPASLMQFDVPAFVNQSIGFLFGVGATGVAFRLFANAADNKFLYRRLTRKLRAEVTRACRAPLAGARQRLESASRDLFMQIIGYTGAGSNASRHLLAWALSVHEAGRAVVDLRTDMSNVPESLRLRIQRVVDAMESLYEAPDHARYVRARRAMGSALRVAATSDVPGVLRHLHLLRLALLDRGSVLARFMLPEEEGTEVAHVA